MSKAKEVVVTIQLTVMETDPGDADYVVNKVLDEGSFQDAINEWDLSGRSVEIQHAVVL